VDLEKEKELAGENVQNVLKMIDEKSREYADRVNNKRAIDAFYTMVIVNIFDALSDESKTFVLKQLMMNGLSVVISLAEKENCDCDVCKSQREQNLH